MKTQQEIWESFAKPLFPHLNEHQLAELKIEAVMDTVKSVAKKVGKVLTGGSDQDQLKNLQTKMGVPQTGKKPTSK